MKTPSRAGLTPWLLLLPTLALALTTLRVVPAAAEPAPATPTLPKPTGPFAVGTFTLYLTDSSRSVGPVEKSFARPITVQLWYPAQSFRVTHGGTSWSNMNDTAFAPYLAERGLLDVVVSSGYHGVDSTALRSWSSIRTHAVSFAPVAGKTSQPSAGVDTATHALVTLSHGLGIARANYTSIATELASHGIVVAAIDHPYGGVTLVPPHRVLSRGDDATKWDEAATHARQMDEWAKDIVFVLDRLAAPRRLPPLARGIAQSIDWSCVGAMGHASGGLAAVQAASRDRRIQACVDMDGALASPDGQPLAALAHDGVARPTLMLMSKPDSAATPAGSSATVVSVAGTSSMSFSDAPFVMPATITVSGGEPLDARRCWSVTTSVALEFFEQYVCAGTPNAQAEAAFEKWLAQIPEVTLHKTGQKP